MNSPKLTALLQKREAVAKVRDEAQDQLAIAKLAHRKAIIAEEPEETIAAHQTDMAMLDMEIERLEVRLDGVDAAISAQEATERAELIEKGRDKVRKLAKRKSEYVRDLEASLLDLTKAWQKYCKLDEELLHLSHEGYTNPNAINTTEQVRQYIQVELERAEILDKSPRVTLLHGRSFADLTGESLQEIVPHE